jgi:hypothetical protein
MREWSEEELRLLDKAVNKFPQVRSGPGPMAGATG